MTDLPCDSEPRDETIIPFPDQTSGRVVYLSLWRGTITIKRGPTMAQIVAEVAERSGLTPADLRGDSLKRNVTQARHEAMAEIRRRTGRSFPLIGQFFHRDHSTVVYACRDSMHSSRIVPVSSIVPASDGAVVRE